MRTRCHPVASGISEWSSARTSVFAEGASRSSKSRTWKRRTIATRSFDASSNESIRCEAHPMMSAKSQHDATWTFSFCLARLQKRLVRTMLLSLFPRTMLLSLFLHQSEAGDPTRKPSHTPYSSSTVRAVHQRQQVYSGSMASTSPRWTRSCCTCSLQPSARRTKWTSTSRSTRER